eukprot:CAMPEP_0204836214 /NCGR_PEP_ID=MMETSP1346-20131115/24497_1 /ASSEMBLY_ACC=CAM_ASM_000771 /TAXON_ID=215587 /ORGANISM="Aplanochytrium stocchinoi, Strain GSBS06" /LENGTH=44 /DNA_ID= /DNA_START= /DNA_END= /DNA_ORIENTATION=
MSVDSLKGEDLDLSEVLKVVPTFDGMQLSEDLLRGIYAYGFEKP